MKWYHSMAAACAALCAAGLPSAQELGIPQGSGMQAARDAAKAGDSVEVGIRPENVTLDTGLSMQVRVLERLGGVSITYGAMPDGTRFCAALPGDAR